MTFIHIADLHANKSRLQQCLDVLDKIYNFILAQEEKPYLLIAGDFWDSAIQNTDSSGFTEYELYMQKIINVTKVYMIYGTPSHENSGSLEVFKLLGAKVYDTNTFEDFGDFEIVAIPEPRRTKFITSSTEQTNKLINNDNENFILNLPKKSKPRIVLYHGEVEGAVYQNNMSASSPIAISKKLLQQTGADYIALGHIHEPQTLWDFCSYSGSCYPVNSGEHHDAGFNFIKIENSVSVKRISFKFPINVTEYALFSELDEIKRKDFSNRNLNLKLSIEKSLKKNFDKSKLEEEIKVATHAEKVNITFEFKTQINIRSEQVVKEKSIVDKFKIYCDLNDIKITDETTEKLKEIQDNLLIDSFVPCDTFELESLQLRGAIGIKDGIGLDEFNIDFTKYKTGILLLAGANGAGKSTILENCHPFPRLLTRTGSLKEHFCLHDSHRILVYKTSSGKKIKITMLIDGTKTSNLTRYYVETLDKPGDSWKSYKGVDGSYDSYVEWLESTFGSVDMFLRTSFYANRQVKGIPDLAYATKSEKMELFTNLAGTDYLTTISDAAKEQAKKLDEEIKDVKKDLRDYDEIKSTAENNESIILKNSELIDKEKKQLEEDIKKLSELEDKQREFLEAVGSANFLRKEIVEKRNKLLELDKKIESTKTNIAQLEKDLENKDFYQEQLNWWESSIKQETEIRNKKENLNDLIQSYSFKKNELQIKENELNKQLSAQREENIRIDGDIKVLKKSLNTINDICPVCGEKLSEHKKEQLETENKEINTKIQSLESEKTLVFNKIDDIKTSLNDNKKLFEDCNKELEKLSAKLQDCNLGLTQINDYRLTVDIEKARHILTDVSALLKKDEEYLQTLFKEKTDLESVILDFEKQVENIPDDFSDEISKLKRWITNSQTQISDLTAEKKQAEKELLNLKEKINLIKEVDDKIQKLNSDFKDYTIIQKAFSNNGIQSLELDSAAPEISMTANQILSSTYGDRFSISFETQRDTKDGRKIDDFIINVFDAKSGRNKKLELLSGGESVWIKNALYYAFSVVRSRRSGFCFKTRFLDESDGTLDSDARIKYLKMIESAHRACNANLTILVTHSPEIKEGVDQKIELF